MTVLAGTGGPPARTSRPGSRRTRAGIRDRLQPGISSEGSAVADRRRLTASWSAATTKRCAR
ncbi:hypothetical protein ACPA9J_16540 [Pseudomonas aeruginosa]